MSMGFKLIWNGADITEYCTSASWTGSAAQAARSLTFSVVYNPNDKNVKVLDINTGDKIEFVPDYPKHDKKRFVGMVTTRDRKNTAGTLSYTAMDGMIHLLRSSGTYKFKKKTPEKIASMVAKDVGIKTGHLEKINVNINKMFFSQRSYYEIIMAAYTEAHKKTGKQYMAQMDNGKLEVIEKGKVIPDFYLVEGERIIESSYSDTLDSMVNRVYIYNSENKKIGSVSKPEWVSKYGVFQNSITVDSGSGKTEAKNELHWKDRSANLTAIGNVFCVSGVGLIVKESRTGLNGKYWVENDTHTWENGVYTMSLDLAFQNVMDMQNGDEEQETSGGSGGASGSGGSSGGSSALEDVLNQARAWLGVTENPPGSNHNEITQYYGWDAAWCCMFIWGCFNKSGHGNIFMNGGKTAYCFDVMNWYKARGKWGSTPKKGALIIYGGSGHIGIIESVSGSSFVSIEGNLSNMVKRSNGASSSAVLGYCYPDYPEDKAEPPTPQAVTGNAINIPSNVPQTGISGNYTCYPQLYGRWLYEQKTVSELWARKGKKGSPENIATIDGYYLIAVATRFGKVGDMVSVIIEGGSRINCIIADSKNSGDSGFTGWGHDLGGGKSDIIEWESMIYGQPNVSKWRGKKVTTIINGGRYKGL